MITERSIPSFAQDFHAYYLKQARQPSAIAFLFVGLNFIAGHFYSNSLLGLPLDVPGSVHLAQWGLVIPACLLTAAALSYPRSRLKTEWVIIVGILLVSTGIVLTRRAWQISGAEFPIDYSIYVMALIAAVAGIGFRMLIAVVPVVCLNMVSNYLTNGFTPHAHFEAIGIFSTGLVVGVISWQVQRAMHRMWLDRQRFESLSRTDPLTGLLNRRAFEETTGILMAQARRSERPVAVAMLDIDFFKAYNDHYGHAAGDIALRQVAQSFSSHARRPLDVCARMGGEEFAIIWYDVTEAQAQQLCENVMRGVQLLNIPHEHQLGGRKMTVSLGACHTEKTRAHEFENLLAEADRNLYLAKQRGRNCHVFTGSVGAETHFASANAG